MSTRLLMIFIAFTQAMIALAVLLVLVTFVVHVTRGGPFTTNWAVEAGAAVGRFPLADDAGVVRIDRGTLALVASDWKPEFAQLIFVGIFAVGAYSALERFKTVVREIAAGTPFSEGTVRGLRMIGYLLLGWAAIEVLDALLVQPLILQAARPANDAFTIGGSISRGSAVDTVQSFRLSFHFDLLKIGAALIALTLAQAFAIGRRLSDDNATIV